MADEVWGKILMSVGRRVMLVDALVVSVFLSRSCTSMYRSHFCASALLPWTIGLRNWSRLFSHFCIGRQ